MPIIIILALLIWAISSIVKSASAKKAERNRQAQIARLNAENARRKAEAARIREEFRIRQAEAKAEVQRIVAIEREQMRLAKEQEKQAARLEKVEAEQRKIKATLYKAVKDIDHLTYEMEQKRKYGEYLELERDACVKYGAEWHKWNNKVSTNNNQLYAMETKLDKALANKAEAERKIA